MIEQVSIRDGAVPFKTACDALGVAISTAYRHLAPGPKVERYNHPKKPSPRRLAESEREEIVEVMHSDRFLDQTVKQAHAELLDEGRYIASTRTFYRVLAERGETKERRAQRTPRSFAVPHLTASSPNKVWTWDITKLPTCTSGKFLNLYVVLDLFSRYPVAWMVAHRENSALSKQLFAEAISKHGIEPGTLIAHNDRGAPMTAIGFTDLLAELGVESSLSRPRVSNDNPFSESCFKTLKYQPDYPGRFLGLEHAREWCDEFFDWYGNQHRHSSLAFFTPHDVFTGRYEKLAAKRQEALNEAWLQHPERFVNGRPTTKLPPATVYINRIEPVEDDHRIKDDGKVPFPSWKTDSSSLDSCHPKGRREPATGGIACDLTGAQAEAMPPVFPAKAQPMLT